MNRHSHLSSARLATHQQWMRLALEQAAKALPTDVPVGAMLVQTTTGRCIASGYNRREFSASPTAHAELLVLERAAQQLGRWRLSDCTLYVTLEPCPMCASAMRQARLGQLVFGAADVMLGAAGSRYNLLQDPAPLPAVPVLAGVLEAPCRQLLQASFLPQRKAHALPSSEPYRDCDV
ncbi:MAG: nucleoside deaminase [Candidatus Melainabacteria bacterium]|nr:nucleoside deaminase [Candidatus Melainabacteria bacterium]